MPSLWLESLPNVIAVANQHYAKGRHAKAAYGYELAAKLAREAEMVEAETEFLHAAWYCDERASGRMPKETWA